MVEIKDRESLEAWLKDHQKEDAHVIAARAFLRTLPVLGNGIENARNDFRTVHLIPSFRWGVLVSAAMGKPDRRSEFAFTQKPMCWVPVISASRTLYAIFEEPDNPKAATSALVASIEDIRPNELDAWRAVSRDLTALDDGIARHVVSGLPLWPDPNQGYIAYLMGLRVAGIDEDVSALPFSREYPHSIASGWSELRQHLEFHERNENWHVWTDWYQDRLDGKLLDEELELKKALIPNETWEQGPAVVNAEIARIVEEHNRQKTEAQDPPLRDPSRAEQPKAELSETEAGQATRTLITRRTVIATQVADLHDRVEQEIELRRAERRNDDLATQNIAFLEGLLPTLSTLSDVTSEMPEEPSEEESEPVVQKAWNLRDQIEEYTSWIAGEEHAREVANGTLIGGMATLVIQFGWAPLPVTAAAVAIIGGRKLKDHLTDLIKQMKGG